jgi:hypothetical protein
LKAISDELDALKEKLNLIGDIQALTHARTQFTDLIEEVNQVLRFIVTGDMNTNEESCAGDCGGCSACGQLH